MPLRSLLSSIVLASLVLLLAAPTTAKAQSLIDFLWGGSSEWGGGRQTVSFDPKYTPGQVIVSFGDRRLYHITRKGQATSYPIAVPRDQSRWQGTTTVSEKKINPSWRPTPDMLKENPKLPSWVPGGHPMNPLGVRAMYLGASTYRIHGTDAPWTIGQAVSKGCIRMFNEDVLDLYPRIPVGTRVTVTWERFSTNQSVASSTYNDAPSDAPQPFQPTSYESSPSRRTIRNLPPLPQSVRDAQTAAVRMEPVTPATNEKKPAASKSTDAKPSAHSAGKAKADTDKSPSATAASGAKSAAEAATRAAAAAAKAAEAARKAAEAAKKAAEDAKKATSADAEKQPEKAPPKSAAL